MKLKELLKFMFLTICAITTFEVLYIAAELLITGSDWLLSAWDLLKIVFVALMGSLPILILSRKENASRRELIIRQTVHFFLTGGVVGGLLVAFEWMTATNAVYVATFFICIYAALYAVGELRARKLAKALNERINAFHADQNETHRP